MARFGAIWLITSSVLFGHPVPDGAIYRGIQVVMRPDRIEIRYQLGLNDSMVQRELVRLLDPGEPCPTDSSEALLRYRDLMFPALPEKMAITIDGNETELQPQRADIVRQHHAQLEFIYEISHKAPATPAKFVLVDDNFQGVPGYHLAAVKSRGRVEVLDGNAEQLLNRMSRPSSLEDEAVVPQEPMRRVEAFFCSPIATPPPPAAKQSSQYRGNNETNDEPPDSLDGPSNHPTASAVDRQGTNATSVPPTDVLPRPPGNSKSPPRAYVFWVLGAFIGAGLMVWVAILRRQAKRRAGNTEEKPQ